ncbi:MAG: hypothetical protein PHT99_01475, partial [Methanoregula sp.]|nr:hypothetical protein [Methanoregula sp.]
RIDNPMSPTITSINQTSGFRNSTVVFTLTGKNFQPDGTGVRLNLNATVTPIDAALTSVTGTRVTGRFTIPADQPSGKYRIDVLTISGGSVMKQNAFTISPLPKPTIGTITPTSGFANGTVSYTLKGTNFQPGLTTVDLSNPGFGELNTTIYSITATQIIGGVSFPGNAPTGSWTLNVTTLDGGKDSKATAFKVNTVLPPAITSFTPAMGYRGTTVSYIVDGKYFQPGGRTSVNLSQPGAPEIQTTLSSVYSSRIYGTVTIPEDAATGSWKVNVTTIDGGEGKSFNAIKVL